MTNPNVRRKIASADDAVAPSLSLAELEARLPLPKPMKPPRLTYVTRKAFAKADARYYRGRVPGRSSGHRAASRIRVFARDNGLSVKGGFAKLAPDLADPESAPVQHVQHVDAPMGYCRECLKAIPYTLRADAKFCSDTHSKAFRRRAAKIEVANREFKDCERDERSKAETAMLLDRAGHEEGELVADVQRRHTSPLPSRMSKRIRALHDEERMRNLLARPDHETIIAEFREAGRHDCVREFLMARNRARLKSGAENPVRAISRNSQ
jgi:hypothetical protein